MKIFMNLWICISPLVPGLCPCSLNISISFLLLAASSDLMDWSHWIPEINKIQNIAIYHVEFDLEIVLQITIVFPLSYSHNKLTTFLQKTAAQARMNRTEKTPTKKERMEERRKHHHFLSTKHSLSSRLVSVSVITVLTIIVNF